MDLRKRVDSMEQALNNALNLLQPQPKLSTRTSQRSNTQTALLINYMDPIFKGLNQLKEDLNQLKEDLNRVGSTTNQTSLPVLVDGGDSQQGANEGSRSADSNLCKMNMGIGLVESLGRYGNFAGKIHISDLGNFDLAGMLKRTARPDPKLYASLFVEHLSDIGSSRLRLGENPQRGLSFPDFSEVQCPQGYEKSFENIIASPPKGAIFYYVGPPLAPDFNTLLSPGKLLELGEVQGVNTPYWHVGEKDSGTAFHFEDAAIRSCNVTITGFKLWILIDVSSNDDFETFVTSLEPSAAEQPRCGQWLRHLNILVSPEKLTEQGIKYDLILAGPGDMVITTPRQYHAVLNLTACFAVAINFVLPEDPLLTETLVCCSDCGFHYLKHTAIKRIPKRGQKQADKSIKKLPKRGQKKAYKSIKKLPKRGQKKAYKSIKKLPKRGQKKAYKSIAQPVPKPAVLKPAGGDFGQNTVSVEPSILVAGSASETTSEQNKDGEDITPEEQRGDSHSIVGSSSPSSSGHKRVASSQKVSNRSKQLCPPVENGPCFEMQLRKPIPTSKASQVFEMIRSQHALKQFCNLVSTKRNLQLHRVFTSVQKSAARRLVAMEKVETSCKVFKLINQYLFAIELEKTRSDMKRIDPSDKQRIIKDTGLKENQYKVAQRDGDHLRKLCGSFDGILCFLPVERCFEWQRTTTDYVNKMDKSDYKEFHGLLKKDDVYIKNLCVAGKAFQRSLGGRDTYFAWETSNLDTAFYELLPEDSRLQYIKPMGLQEDIFDATEFPNLPDPWVIPVTETPCYCSSESCNCYEFKISEAKLRIMVSPMKQLHLQAISEEPKAVVYKAKEVLGFLTGKLVPPGTLEDHEWVFDTKKCQVDCRDESNEFKLLHHACQAHAIAELTEERVSGRIRLAVVARKDICDGEKITICFNSGHKTCAECEGGIDSGF